MKPRKRCNLRKRERKRRLQAAALNHYRRELERAHVVPEAIELATIALQIILKSDRNY